MACFDFSDEPFGGDQQLQFQSYVQLSCFKPLTWLGGMNHEVFHSFFVSDLAGSSDLR
nr:hypothetical protein Iba_chr12dCG12160 [Ipomoea batatas]